MADLTSPPHFPFPAASPARRNSGGEDAFSRLVNFLRLTVELFLRIRYQAPFLLVCICVCMQNFWVNRAFRSFWLYGVTVFFAPFFLLLLAFWLWGLGFWIFSRVYIDYRHTLEMRYRLSPQKILKVSYWSTVIILISFTAFARMAYYRYHIFISDSPLIVLHLVFLYFLTIADSGSILYLISPRYMLRVIDLILCQKVILFSDLFWVDVMTSIIKIVSHFEDSICLVLMWHTHTLPTLHAEVVCRIVKSITPAIPYLIRTGLLLVQYRTFTVMKLFVVGLKCFTGILSVYIYYVGHHESEDIWMSYYMTPWIQLYSIHAVCSVVYEMQYDWDVSRSLTVTFGLTIPRILSRWTLFGRTLGWYLVAVSNALLRFTWTYKLFPSLKDSHSVEFVVTALEIWRRFIWCIFKVDQEWRQRQEQEQEQERGRG